MTIPNTDVFAQVRLFVSVFDNAPSGGNEAFVAPRHSS